jgi:hypothetical protein
MASGSISEIGAKLVQAGRLQVKPLCAYGSAKIPDTTIPSTSISPCIARAIVTRAFQEKAPPIYVAAQMPDTCCGGGLAHFGFTKFNPGIKYFVSTGSKDFRNGEAEFLRATPELVEENQRRMGKITPLGKYVIIRPCSDLVNEDPGVKSILCFGTAEHIRNMCALVHFRSINPFSDVLVPQGASCSAFVSYASGMVETAPPNAVFLGPCDPTGNSWFPQEWLSLAMPIKIARRMAEDLESSFIVKRPSVAYPEQRIPLPHLTRPNGLL